MGKYIHARLKAQRDDDLIKWLEEQSAGAQSEAIRALLRDGLRMRQLDVYLSGMIRQAVTDSLDTLQFQAPRPSQEPDSVAVEAEFGGKLDDLLNKFG